jgi:hypothetical protein
LATGPDRPGRRGRWVSALVIVFVISCDGEDCVWEGYASDLSGEEGSCCDPSGARCLYPDPGRGHDPCPGHDLDRDRGPCPVPSPDLSNDPGGSDPRFLTDVVGSDLACSYQVLGGAGCELDLCLGLDRGPDRGPSGGSSLSGVNGLCRVAQAARTRLRRT